MPDLKASFNADKNNTTVTRGTSLPLRQRVYPYHFIPQESDELAQNSRQQYDNNDWSTPLRHCSVKKRSGLSHTTSHEPSTLSSPPIHVHSIDATLHNHHPDRTTPSHPARIASPPPSFNQNEPYPQRHLDHLQHHQQQRTRRLARHRAFSQDSLPGHIDTRFCAVPEPEKELPPTPPGSASPISPLSASQLSHVVPFSSSVSLKRQDSIGVIPQDASRSMDQKTLQKVITQASVSSRVYKVMEQEQVDSLRKEQDEVQHFVEALNVSLHIETRMRDASHSLIRLHENNSNLSAVREATAQLNTTTRKMDQIVQKIQHSMWRLLAIQKVLLQHEGAVLNVGMRRLDNENRELSRTVRHLEEAHSNEKEERAYWKNRHSKLKVQSILFQELPIVSTGDNLAMEKTRETETYIKELQDEITKRAENETNLEKRLQAVCNWTDDFSLAVDIRSPTNLASTPKESPSSEHLQDRLKQLRSNVEGEFKRLDTRIEDWKSIVEAAELAEDQVTKNGRPSVPSPRYSHLDIANHHRLSLSSLSASRNGDSVPREGSPLQMILDESLIELERQIFSERSTSSRPSSTSTAASSTISFLDADDSDNASDEGAIADAHNEIRKLNAMVSELELRARAIDR
ncbi:hypothetical protein BG000_000008 [Podila horticola]|nr:hypothetical protein BG000_000008 [Podila horticola]